MARAYGTRMPHQWQPHRGRMNDRHSGVGRQSRRTGETRVAGMAEADNMSQACGETEATPRSITAFGFSSRKTDPTPSFIQTRRMQLLSKSATSKTSSVAWYSTS